MHIYPTHPYPLAKRLLRHCILLILASVLAATAFVVQAAKFNVLVSSPGIPANGGVINAGVYATLVSGVAPPKPPREILIEQINKEFVPLVSIVQVGTPINFPNRDQIRHHVFSFSPAKTFEIKLYSGVQSKPVVFDKPGEVVLGCNIHDTMIAYVLVVDTPYFAKTGADGRALLDDLPAGEYEVHMWYPIGAAVPAPQRMKLSPSSTIEVKFTFTPRPNASPRASPNLGAPGAGK